MVTVKKVEGKVTGDLQSEVGPRNYGRGRRREERHNGDVGNTATYRRDHAKEQWARRRRRQAQVAKECNGANNASDRVASGWFRMSCSKSHEFSTPTMTSVSASTSVIKNVLLPCKPTSASREGWDKGAIAFVGLQGRMPFSTMEASLWPEILDRCLGSHE